MKKNISTIVAAGLISSMLASTAFAGGHRGEEINPLWVPVAILSTVAATVATIVQAPFVYERHEYPEPRRTIIYEEPRQYRHEYYYDRSHGDRERSYDQSGYRGHRGNW